MSLSESPARLAPSAVFIKQSGPITETKHAGAPDWLTTVKLPAAAVLDLNSSVLVLASDNRAEDVFNAFADGNRTVTREWWLAQVGSAEQRVSTLVGDTKTLR